MESGLFLKMAQQATKDPALLAAYIDAAAKKEPGGWRAVALRLHIDEQRLAKLALCRRPASHQFDTEVRQIAALVNADPVSLSLFLRDPAAGAVKPKQIRSQRAVQKSPVSFRWLGWTAGVVLVTLLLLSAFAFTTSARGSQATLVVQQGQATVTSGGLLSSWLTTTRSVVSAGKMQPVKTGDRIAMGPKAAADLTFYDGSSVVLAENTELVVYELNTTDTSYRVRLQQLGGVTLSRVVRLLGVGDVFEIHTPSSTVSVRGTEFVVAVQSIDRSWLAVVKGVVHAVMGKQEADVHPGEQLLMQVGQPFNVQPQNASNPLVPPVVTPVPGSAPGTGSNPGSGSTPGAPNQTIPPNAPAGTSAPNGTGPTDNTGSGGASATEAPSSNPSGGSTTGGSTSGGSTTGGSSQPPKIVPGNPPGDSTGPQGGGNPPGKDKNSGKNNSK